VAEEITITAILKRDTNNSIIPSIKFDGIFYVYYFSIDFLWCISIKD